LIWVPFIALDIVAVPDVLLTFPIIAAFFVTLVHFACASACASQFILADAGAMIVFMSVQWTVASAPLKAALPASHSFFHRTRKARGGRESADYDDAGNAARALLAAAPLRSLRSTSTVIWADLFATILLLQSLPFCRPWRCVAGALRDRK